MRADIVVVGAGTAGCAAALAAASAGAEVLLLGDPPALGDRPGESLSPAANAILAGLGVEGLLAGGGHRPANSGYAAWGAPLLAQKNVIQSLEGAGHVLDRARFDRDLAAAACARPGIFRRPVRVAAVVREGSVWTIGVSDGGSVRTPFLIDASGRRAEVARRLSPVRRADRLVGVCSFLTSRDPEVEPTPATLVEAAPDGWWYAALLPDGRLTLAYFSDPDLLPKGIGRDPAILSDLLGRSQFVRQWLDSAGFHPTEAPRPASAATAWLERAAGEGWAAAGDAAAALDPLSSHGLTSALWTGRRAGETAMAALSGDGEAIDRYAASLARGVTEFLAQRRHMYGAERRWRDRPFWRRRQAPA